MSRLNFKFNDNKGGEAPKPGEGEAAPEKNIDLYEVAGTVRTISFVQVNGDETVLNYSELRKMELSLSTDHIELTFFGGETVTIKGSNLDVLFQSFKQHLPKRVACTDERYRTLKKEDETIVTEIIIEDPIKG